MAFSIYSLFKSHVPTEIDLGPRGAENGDVILKYMQSLRAIYEKNIHYRLGIENHQSVYLSYINICLKPIISTKHTIYIFSRKQNPDLNTD